MKCELMCHFQVEGFTALCVLWCTLFPLSEQPLSISLIHSLALYLSFLVTHMHTSHVSLYTSVPFFSVRLAISIQPSMATSSTWQLVPSLHDPSNFQKRETDRPSLRQVFIPGTFSSSQAHKVVWEVGYWVWVIGKADSLRARKRCSEITGVYNIQIKGSWLSKQETEIGCSDI